MPRCTHKGCGQEYDEAANTDSSCSYHPGGPIFHEGLKSWSCCKDVNKPVLEFDQFMALPTCTTGRHSSEEAPTPVPEPVQTAAPTETKSGVETYGTAPSPAPAPPTAPAPPPKEAKEEEDDLSIPVPAGAKCKRLACGAEYVGDASRGDGPEGVCTYHPQNPVFHEGSKGYLCCKRRVLEFSEFLKIPGCKTGKHLFVGQKKESQDEEVVDCRVDHYQTPLNVHVSAYAKGADKASSTVTFHPQSLDLDLTLPDNKRVRKSLTLYGPIVPEKSTFRVLGSKVDITLVKPQPASWPLLELPPAGTELPPGYALTFGVSGRTGTVGGKEIVLSEESRR